MSITHSEAEDTLILELINNMPSIDGNQIDVNKLLTPNAPEPDTSGDVWMRAVIQWDRATTLEAGLSGLDVTEGVFAIDIFCKQNVGNKIYKQIQTQLISHFNKKRFNGCVDVYEPFPVNIGHDGPWYHYQVQFTCRITF